MRDPQRAKERDERFALLSNVNISVIAQLYNIDPDQLRFLLGSLQQKNNPELQWFSAIGGNLASELVWDDSTTGNLVKDVLSDFINRVNKNENNIKNLLPSTAIIWEPNLADGLMNKYIELLAKESTQVPKSINQQTSEPNKSKISDPQPQEFLQNVATETPVQSPPDTVVSLETAQQVEPPEDKVGELPAWLEEIMNDPSKQVNLSPVVPPVSSIPMTSTEANGEPLKSEYPILPSNEELEKQRNIRQENLINNAQREGTTAIYSRFKKGFGTIREGGEYSLNNDLFAELIKTYNDIYQSALGPQEFSTVLSSQNIYELVTLKRASSSDIAISYAVLANNENVQYRDQGRRPGNLTVITYTMPAELAGKYIAEIRNDPRFMRKSLLSYTQNQEKYDSDVFTNSKDVNIWQIPPYEEIDKQASAQIRVINDLAPVTEVNDYPTNR